MNGKEQFNTLKTKEYWKGETNKFHVEPIEGTRHKIGISVEGYPKFFICTSNHARSTRNKILRILTVEYNLACIFVDDDKKNENLQYTVITLCSDDEMLQNEFIDIMMMILQKLKPIPDKRDIAIEVENMVSIFSIMNNPPKKQLQGLWAELLVIELSKYPETLINAWHNNPNSKYDFTLGCDKIEVKSTSSETRKHHFAYEQLKPSKNSHLLIASVQVRESGKGAGGLSVIDLRDKICDRISQVDMRIKVYSVINETLGSDIYKANGMFFDYVGAADSIRYYDANEIHKVHEVGVDAGVSGIGFDSDLSDVTSINESELSHEYADSPLYKSIL